MQTYKDSIKMGSRNKELKKDHCPARDSSLFILVLFSKNSDYAKQTLTACRPRFPSVVS